LRIGPLPKTCQDWFEFTQPGKWLNQGLFFQVFDIKTWQNISKNLAKIAEYTLEREKKKKKNFQNSPYV
jgi:hypothetical protein